MLLEYVAHRLESRHGRHVIVCICFDDGAEVLVSPHGKLLLDIESICVWHRVAVLAWPERSDLRIQSAWYDPRHKL